MAPRTATVFSLALFPQVFLFQRVLNADVVFVLSDRRLDDRNPANQCVLRSDFGATQRIEIPVHRRGVPIDQVEVPEPDTWFPEIQQQVARIYSGLPMASAATGLVSQMLPPYPSPWLTDYLLHPFVVTLRCLGWEKEIVRGATEQRRRYSVDAEYWLDLCLHNGCDRFIVGADAEARCRPLFRGGGVRIISQHWHGPADLSARDSILDAVARFSVSDVRGRMQQN
jgi:WbqC-like protein family